MADLTIEANIEMKNSGVLANTGENENESALLAIAKCTRIVAGDQPVTAEHAQKVAQILEILKELMKR